MSNRKHGAFRTPEERGEKGEEEEHSVLFHYHFRHRHQLWPQRPQHR